VKPYTEMLGLSDLVLEESFVLGITASPAQVVLDVEFVLTTSHPAYAPPPPDENESYRRGQIRFIAVRRLIWDLQGATPAADATGEIDYGHIDDFRWDGETFELEGDWGQLRIEAGSVEVEV